MTIFRLLPVYAPLLFLAAMLFWLAPPKEEPFTPSYTIAIDQARYTRVEDDGNFLVVAERIEQKTSDAAQLLGVEVTQENKNGRLVLRGARGEAIRQESGAMLTIQEANGVIESNGRRLTLSADNVLYDADSGKLSGGQSHIVFANGDLRADGFLWDPNMGLKARGNVKSVYQR